MVRKGEMCNSNQDGWAKMHGERILIPKVLCGVCWAQESQEVSQFLWLKRLEICESWGGFLESLCYSEGWVDEVVADIRLYNFSALWKELFMEEKQEMDAYLKLPN